MVGWPYNEFCTMFFHQMDNNYCVNTLHSEYGTTGFAGSQWCVVSKECQELNGGRPIENKQTFYYGPSWLASLAQYEWYRNFMDGITAKKEVPRDVSWKLCTKGKDKLLRDIEPEEYFKMTTSMNSCVGYATKMAWPRLLPSGPEGKPGGKDWAHVQEAVEKGDIANLPKILQDAIADNQPIVIDVDPNGHTSQRIVHGKHVYYIDNECTSGTPEGCGAKQWPLKKKKKMGDEL